MRPFGRGDVLSGTRWLALRHYGAVLANCVVHSARPAVARVCMGPRLPELTSDIPWL